MKSIKMQQAIDLFTQYFLEPPDHDHETEECPVAAVESLGLNKRQYKKAMRTALAALMQEGYIIRQDEHGDFKAIALDDVPPDVRQEMREDRS